MDLKKIKLEVPSSCGRFLLFHVKYFATCYKYQTPKNVTLEEFKQNLINHCQLQEVKNFDITYQGQQISTSDKLIGDIFTQGTKFEIVVTPLDKKYHRNTFDLNFCPSKLTWLNSKTLLISSSEQSVLLNIETGKFNQSSFWKEIKTPFQISKDKTFIIMCRQQNSSLKIFKEKDHIYALALGNRCANFTPDFKSILWKNKIFPIENLINTSNQIISNNLQNNNNLLNNNENNNNNNNEKIENITYFKNQILEDIHKNTIVSNNKIFSSDVFDNNKDPKLLMFKDFPYAYDFIVPVPNTQIALLVSCVNFKSITLVYDFGKEQILHSLLHKIAVNIKISDSGKGLLQSTSGLHHFDPQGLIETGILKCIPFKTNQGLDFYLSNQFVVFSGNYYIEIYDYDENFLQKIYWTGISGSGCISFSPLSHKIAIADRKHPQTVQIFETAQSKIITILLLAREKSENSNLYKDKFPLDLFKIMFYYLNFI